MPINVNGKLRIKGLTTGGNGGGVPNGSWITISQLWDQITFSWDQLL